MTVPSISTYAMIVAYKKKGHYSVNPVRTAFVTKDNLTQNSSFSELTWLINMEKF